METVNLPHPLYIGGRQKQRGGANNNNNNNNSQVLPNLPLTEMEARKFRKIHNGDAELNPLGIHSVRGSAGMDVRGRTDCEWLAEKVRHR